MDKHAMDRYQAVNADIANKYGRIVRAIEISNREYRHRCDKLKSSRRMREPPSSERIFSGYLVVRNPDSGCEYETWIPDHGFDEIYEIAE